MPTEQKVESVALLKEKFENASIVISADYTGMSVTAMTSFRHALRDQGVEFRVIKNSLAFLAADAANKPLLKEIIEGPTGVAIGVGDPVEPARALVDFIKASRAPMVIRGGLMDDRTLTATEVGTLAALPPKDRLLALLLAQMLAPITGLVYVLNAPLQGLATVLQRRAEVLASEGEGAVAEAEADEEQATEEAVAAAEPDVAEASEPDKTGNGDSEGREAKAANVPTDE
jgi:large subunit ribosomal protein L10